MKNIFTALAVIAMAFMLGGCSSDVADSAKEILEKGLPEHFAKNGVPLVVDKVENVKMICSGVGDYKGFADVTVSTRSHRYTEKIQYSLVGSLDLTSGDLLLEYKPSDGDEARLLQLGLKAAFE